MQDLQKTIELIIDYIKGVWFKKRYIIICSWLICPIGFVYVMALPNVYESQAKVFVDTRSVLQPLLRGLAIPTNPEQEINMLVKTLLSRANVETIARESDLDITTTNTTEYENLISKLTTDIHFKSAGRDNLYTIAYANPNAEMAKTVVQKTLDLFVESAQGKNRTDSDSATQFLEEQIDEYQTRLSAAEQRLADFKRKYSDLLPNQGSFYQNYNELEKNLEQTQLTIRETEQQMKSLDDQIKASRSQTSDFAVQPSNSTSTLTTRFDSRISALESKLDELMLKYTELHPDVIETKNLLESLKQQRDKELEAYFANESGSNTEQVGTVASELRLEANRLQSQIASLKVRESDYQNKIDTLKQKIDLVPQVEAELTALNRDYGITKSKYEELLSRKESSDLSKKADISSDDVKFRVITPPLAPTKPSGPKRILLYTAVLIIGLASGIGIAFIISQINPILIRGNQLTSLTNYPVLGVVSHLNIKQIQKNDRVRYLVFFISCGMIVSIYALLVAADIMSINLYARVMA